MINKIRSVERTIDKLEEIIFMKGAKMFPTIRSKVIQELNQDRQDLLNAVCSVLNEMKKEKILRTGNDYKTYDVSTLRDEIVEELKITIKNLLDNNKFPHESK